jgi:hypothetical protein
MTDTDRIDLFSNGEDYRNWLWNNCDRCLREPDCSLRDALAAAYVCDGTVSQEVAQRLGAPDDGIERWWCRERQTEVEQQSTQASFLSDAAPKLEKGRYPT